MTATVPTTEPQKFVRKTTVSWTKNLADYTPDDGWTLYYYLQLEGGTDQQTITGSDNGDGTHLIELETTDTDDYTAGVYHYQALVKNNGDSVLVGEGRLTVVESFELETGGTDPRTTTKVILDAIEALLQGKVTRGDVAHYSIGTRSLAHIPIEELMVFEKEYRARWLAEIAKEKRERGEQPRGRILVRLP